MGKRTPLLSTLQNNQVPSSYKVHFAFMSQLSRFCDWPASTTYANYNVLNNEYVSPETNHSSYPRGLASRVHF